MRTGQTIVGTAPDLGVVTRAMYRLKDELQRDGASAFGGQGHARDAQLMAVRRERAQVN
jgi:hypothetical protein